MTVIYAEKPDLARKIAAALDKNAKRRDGYIELEYKNEAHCITWGFGHMYGLQDARDYNAEWTKWDLDVYPVFPERYVITPRKDASAQIKTVNTLLKRADVIVNAADADREGELIFAYVLEAAKVGNVPVKRLWLHSYLPSDIRNSFDNMKSGEEMRQLESAARARAIVDWSIGINMTIYATKLFRSEGREPISIGRVQTPTLAMLVERELAIRAFDSRPFWTLHGHFFAENGEYDGVYKTEQLFDKNEAEKLLAKCESSPIGEILSVERKEEKVPPPRLYNLTELQKDMNKQCGLTAKQTLSIAQKLYENQLISYPRSSSQHLPESMRGQVKGTIEKLKKYAPAAKYTDIKSFAPLTKRHFDDSKVESHYAIIPTGQIPSSLTKQEEQVYRAIALSLIRIAYPPAVIEKLEVITRAGECDFKSSGKCVKEAGWMAVDAMPKEQTLPVLEKGETPKGEFKLKEGKTEPPKRYTDATLVNAMAHAGKDVEDDDAREWLKETGIGTEATRAAIIETLMQRGFAIREKKNIMPTDLGISLIGYLPIETLKSPELTGQMEKRLHDIEDGKDDAQSVISATREDIIGWCTKMKGSAPVTHPITRSEKKCPLCGAMLQTRGGRSYSCDAANENGEPCGFSLSGVVCAKSLTEAQLSDILEGKKTMVRGMRSRYGRSFDAFLFLENGKLAFEFENSRPKVENTEPIEPIKKAKCPVCGKALDLSDQSRVKCNCGFSMARTICAKTLTAQEFAKLLAKEPVKVKDMISKRGKKFDATLSIDNNGKLNFSFDK